MHKHAATFFCLLSLAAIAEAASTPDPTRSEYLVSKQAGFEMQEGEGAYYSLTVDLVKSVAGTLYVIARFDNPEDATKPLSTEVIVQAGSRTFHVRSQPLTALKNKKRYKIALQLYSDAACTQLIGSHVQEVVINVDRNMKALIADKFGVKVL
jgi:hypothetical protein